MGKYSRDTMEKMTCEILIERTGIRENRIRSISSRRGYNGSLDDLGKICVALNAGPADLLEVGTHKKRKDNRQGASGRRKKATAPKKRKKARPKAKGDRSPARKKTAARKKAKKKE